MLKEFDEIIQSCVYLFKPFVHLSVILIKLLRVLNDLAEILVHSHQVLIEIVEYRFLDLSLVLFKLIGIIVYAIFAIVFVAFYLKVN